MLSKEDKYKYLEIGSVHTVEFPFVVITEGPDHFGNFKHWKPGYRHLGDFHDGHYTECDRKGSREMTIMSIAEMPKTYQNRVLYSNVWIDPDGERGRKKIMIATPHGFKNLCTRGNMPEEETGLGCDNLAYFEALK